MANRGRPPRTKPEDYTVEVIFETPIEKVREKLTIELYHIYQQRELNKAKLELEEAERNQHGVVNSEDMDISIKSDNAPNRNIMAGI